MKCLMSSRLTMTAVVLTLNADPGDTPTSNTGVWVERQDPESGAIIRVWKPVDIDPTTPGVQKMTINVIARGIITEGVSAAGATEQRKGGNYENIEYVKITYPASVALDQGMQITEIRDSSGRLAWKEDQYGEKPTIFNINGIIPVMDAFNNHLENVAYLKRAEVQP